MVSRWDARLLQGAQLNLSAQSWDEYQSDHADQEIAPYILRQMWEASLIDDQVVFIPASAGDLFNHLIDEFNIASSQYGDNAAPILDLSEWRAYIGLPDAIGPADWMYAIYNGTYIPQNFTFAQYLQKQYLNPRSVDVPGQGAVIVADGLNPDFSGDWSEYGVGAAQHKAFVRSGVMALATVITAGVAGMAFGAAAAVGESSLAAGEIVAGVTEATIAELAPELLANEAFIDMAINAAPELLTDSTLLEATFDAIPELLSEQSFLDAVAETLPEMLQTETFIDDAALQLIENQVTELTVENVAETVVDFIDDIPLEAVQEGAGEVSQEFKDLIDQAAEQAGNTGIKETIQSVFDKLPDMKQVMQFASQIEKAVSVGLKLLGTRTKANASAPLLSQLQQQQLLRDQTLQAQAMRERMYASGLSSTPYTASTSANSILPFALIGLTALLVITR